LEWSNIDGLLRFRGKIYVPWSLDLCRQIVALCHDTQIAGHPGCWKTLDTGRIPRIGFEPRQDPSSLETVNEFTKRMESATEEAKSVICKAQEDMTRYYNRRRSPAPVFKPGDRVYLDASDIRTTRPSPKLSHCRLGPFEIKRQVGPLAY